MKLAYRSFTWTDQASFAATETKWSTGVRLPEPRRPNSANATPGDPKARQLIIARRPGRDVNVGWRESSPPLESQEAVPPEWSLFTCFWIFCRRGQRWFGRHTDPHLARFRRIGHPAPHRHDAVTRAAHNEVVAAVRRSTVEKPSQGLLIPHQRP